ncbi:hypothetical protein [Flavobacterium sp. LM4]|uniref:hypothetical protein n=1 Tax=Flavobacterium sp. LM4 TaxID=1938609 RepID=UPI000993257D|nr:hypothetical protein [Flavobacterium sp. LM4]OOV17450.1 hypothetical protein BXU10_15240 [Flavobacterium sp. LM4]
MNRIKTIAILSVFVALYSCSKDDYNLDSRSVDPFVRFNFITSSAGVPLEYPEVNTGRVPVNTYENKSVKTLKVPVTLTSTTLKSPVTVDFSTLISGEADSFKIEPANELVFEGNKLTDTIFVSFDKRWQNKQTITFKLEDVSDPLVHIGNLNTEALNAIFTINLGEINTVYTFPVNEFFIKGEIGETIDFKVNFPNGFVPSEIENLEIFSFVNGFDYSLTHDDYGDNRSSISYHLTLLEDIQNDDVRYESFITLNTTEKYTTTGNSILQITKPTKVPRDIQANPAANFYNLSDPLYRTYGANWFERNGTCAWFPFNAFTFPVVTTKSNTDAIQYSGQNTTEISDDVYHDAFKIGFNTTVVNSTTNSFGLKNWFTNESTNGNNSPGFNITSALEFFPDNGNSRTSGNVLVIPKFITIAGTNGNKHNIFISGEGTYKQIENGFVEISFELKLKNQELFGGTVSSQYKLYNKTGFPTLTPLSTPCLKPVNL